MKNKIIKPIQLLDKSDQNTLFLKSFDNYIGKYGLYFLFSIITVIIFFIFKDFILLKKIYLFKDIGSDSINIIYPGYYSFSDYLYREGFPRWSFHVGMGQNIFPSINPFSLFIILMGKNLVYYTILCAEVLKIFFAGFFFYLFLKKIDISDYTAIVGAVLYSFTSFIIIWGITFSISIQAVYVALLLYSFEKLYQDDNWILFPVSFFLIALNQPLDLYFIGFFLAIYVIFRLLEANEKEPSKLLSLFTKIIVLGTVGVGMSAFFFINSLHGMIESPRVTGSSSNFNVLLSQSIFSFENFGKSHYLTALMRFFSSDILGTGSDFRGWNNYYEAPLFYCGLISLVSFPHFLSVSDRRKKIIYFALLLIFTLPVIFPFLRYSYWLFTGSYYRILSLFLCLIILFIALKGIDHIDSKSETDIRITIGTLLLLLFFLYYPYKDSHIIDKNIRNTVTVFLIIYSSLIYLIQYKGIKNIIKTGLLCVLIIELIVFHNYAVNKRPVIRGKEISQKVGYNDYTVNAVRYLKLKDKTFFRINKDYSSGTSIHKSLNDAMVQEYYGTPSYHGFNQLNYVRFLHELEIIDGKDEKQTRWNRGLVGWPLLHSFASIKYSLSKDQNPYLLNFGYYPDYPMALFGDVKVLRNKFSLPLGFTYKKYISLKDFRNLSQMHKMCALYKAVVIDDCLYKDMGNLAKLNLSEISETYLFKEYLDDIEHLSQNTLHIRKHGQNKITGSINLDKDKMLFFSIPFDKGWHIKVDGKSITPMMVNIGFIGVPIGRGLHNIELSFTPLYFYTGAVISLVAIFLFIGLVAFKYQRARRLATKLSQQR